MNWLLDWAGHPEKSFFPILIAGTKGKGSTGFFLESILKRNGIKVGFYHSPHLMDPRERIRINGRMISKPAWAQGIQRIRALLSHRKPDSRFGFFTYFEIMTLLAILEFKRSGVKIGILEIGMGGRLDAANSVDAKLAVVTPIHFDHEIFLGNTIAVIAREKAAIIRQGADVVISPQLDSARQVIQNTIRKMKAKPWPSLKVKTKLALEGKHQQINAGAALRAAMILKERYGFPVDKALALRGLQKGYWPGRLESIKRGGPLLLDVAHNPASVHALTSYLKARYKGKKRLLIFGCAKDKKSQAMLKTLSGYFDEVIITAFPGHRAQEPGILAGQARRTCFKRILVTAAPKEAFAMAVSKNYKKFLKVVTGSFYLAGEWKKLISKKTKSL